MSCSSSDGGMSGREAIERAVPSSASVLRARGATVVIAESGVDRFEIAASRTNAKGDNVSDAKMSGLVSDALANVTARKGSFGIIGLCSRGLTPELSRAGTASA